MNGADEARASLASTAGTLYGLLRTAAAAYAHASGAVADSPDLTDAFQAAIALTVAAEDLKAKATEAASTLRTKLATVMSEVGCTTIRGEHHRAHLSTKPAHVWIKEPALLPPDLLVQPPPSPDITTIGKRLRAGEVVPGAVLAGNNEPILVIRPRKDKAT